MGWGGWGGGGGGKGLLRSQIDKYHHFYDRGSSTVQQCCITTVHQYISTTEHQYISTTVHQYNSTTVHQYNSTSVHQYNSTSVQQYISTIGQQRYTPCQIDTHSVIGPQQYTPPFCHGARCGTQISSSASRQYNSHVCSSTSVLQYSNTTLRQRYAPCRPGTRRGTKTASRGAGRRSPTAGGTGPRPHP